MNSQKGKISEWVDLCSERFEHLKRAICSSITLVHTDLNFPYYLYTTSSEESFGTALGQPYVIDYELIKHLVPINVNEALLSMRLRLFTVLLGTDTLSLCIAYHLAQGLQTIATL